MKNHWETKTADFWDTRPDIDTPLYQQVKTFFEGVTDLVEIGCGVGRLSELLEPNQYYSGVDCSPKAITRATLLYSDAKVQFTLGNAMELRFSKDIDSTFVLMHVLDHLPHFTPMLQHVATFSPEQIIVAFTKPLLRDGSSRIVYRKDGAYNNQYSLPEFLDFVDYMEFKVDAQFQAEREDLPEGNNSVSECFVLKPA